MKIVIIGAAGFIGTNLAVRLSKNENWKIVLIDSQESYFSSVKKIALKNAEYIISDFNEDCNFDEYLENTDIVFHLASTSMTTDANVCISEDLRSNIVFTAILLDACVRKNVKKFIFISSGGTVYGKDVKCPIKEDSPTNPITSYGIQKLAIEKLLYLYHYLYRLDYRIIRLANPYGPYQRPNGKLGVLSMFVYDAVNGKTIKVYGDGSVIRDFIYIDDAVEAIYNIAYENSKEKIYNIGSGIGTSIQKIIEYIKDEFGDKQKIEYISSRINDVPVNYLDISRYEREFGKLCHVQIKEGIIRTAKYFRETYETVN